MAAARPAIRRLWVPRRQEGVLALLVLALLALGAGTTQADEGGAAAGGPPTETRDGTLGNGLRYHLRPLVGAKSVAVVLVFDVGGDHDAPTPCGTAHLCEHLFVTAAAGSRPARTAEAFAADYPLGWNAQTGDRSTVIAMVVEPQRLDDALGDLADRLRDLRPTEGDLERERGRVRDELRHMYEGHAGLAAVNHARARARSRLGARCPRPGGDADALRSLTLSDVTTRLHRLYRAGNARLAVAGALDPAAVRVRIDALFVPLPAGEPPAGGPMGTRDVAPSPLPQDTPPIDRFTTVPLSAVVTPAAGHLGIVLGRVDPTGSALPAWLVFLARMQPRLAALGPTVAFPPPLLWAPLDGMDDVVLHVPLRQGETPATAADRVHATLLDALRAPLTAADARAVETGLGTLFGLAPDAALAHTPYLAALSAARTSGWGLSADALRRAMASVQAADLARCVPAPPLGGVVVSSMHRDR